MKSVDAILRIGVLGASGYTGADIVRLALTHPNMEIAALTANTHAGKPMAAVFPHLGFSGLPDLTTVEEADWSAVDVVFCGLPHGTTQDITADVLKRHPHVRFVDMSADFRLRDPAVYEDWYGRPHTAMDMQGEAVYGLSEHNRDAISAARLVACPGCYPTAALLALLPLARDGLIDMGDIVIDAKSGVSGAGRGLKENTLFCEAGEGMSPYGVSKHRHMPEIEQELTKASGIGTTISFTPHLVPMSRGELLTIYVRPTGGRKAADLRAAWQAQYASEPFVHVLEAGKAPATQMVRGSNHCVLNAFDDRVAGRAILVSTLDNLVKGSAGQAIQNMNLMFGLEETTGLEHVALFP
ncbi:MAG: N-acetyl-gamma-glutamyl-phosphate reductase [Rhodobiaceae bacterium]|nr:N-acetyl-gamma-glutamyl-phosphate reductase [Rhodobiaceae bacterium]MCC0052862.1 N-acetyl-gamma-glutamyl-phosphate reductase [Rhodobiaceae bacterium]